MPVIKYKNVNIKPCVKYIFEKNVHLLDPSDNLRGISHISLNTYFSQNTSYFFCLTR